jgi:hypothetical protein
MRIRRHLAPLLYSATVRFIVGFQVRKIVADPGVTAPTLPTKPPRFAPIPSNQAVSSMASIAQACNDSH